LEKGRRDVAARDVAAYAADYLPWAAQTNRSGATERSRVELGGWRTLAMVQRYAHLAPAHLSAAVARLGPAGGGTLGFDLGSADTRRPAPTRPIQVTSR
jgi:hypothetical protein